MGIDRDGAPSRHDELATSANDTFRRLLELPASRGWALADHDRLRSSHHDRAGYLT